MLRLIFTIISLALLPLQPIIGWFIFKAVQTPESIQIVGAGVWVFIAIFQLSIYGSLIVDYWTKRGISTPFN